MYPKVHSNDLCCYIPVRFEEQILQRDVVFCLVQPTGLYYAHLVKEKEWHRREQHYRFWISNLKGHVNGWCWIEHMFGKLVQVLH